MVSVLENAFKNGSFVSLWIVELALWGIWTG